MQTNLIDISEDEIFERMPEVLSTLLRDHTMSGTKPDTFRHIKWGTKDYEALGEGFQEDDAIQVKSITGKYGKVIQPHVCKTKEVKRTRVRDKAEVFTPSWICNAQNNLVDNAWFGRENVFNIEIDNPDGTHDWKPTEGHIEFPDDPQKTWSKYVSDTRLEITCGEAPYLASRYDTITGQLIPLHKRIGLLDRKLRVVSENVNEESRWWYYAQRAYQSIYGYDWQGDNVLLARESLFFTFIEYYMNKFGKEPGKDKLQKIAYIISWNIWQMDGLKFVVPDSCHAEVVKQAPSLFPELEPEQTSTPCKGCLNDKPELHNGIKCLVRDWFAKDKKLGKSFTDLPFYELIKNKK